MPRRVARRRPARRPRRRARKSRIPRSIAPKRGQFASCVETIELSNIVPNQSIYFNFALNMFERAQKLATNFKWYKAAKVVWNIEPNYNTYQAAVNGAAIPYLYTLMNRTGDQTALNINDYLACGMKPKKFTSKLTKSYVPNWCSPGLITYQVNPNPPSLLGSVSSIFQMGSKAERGWIVAPDTFQDLTSNVASQLTQSARLGGSANSGNNIAATSPALCTYYGHNMFFEQRYPIANNQYVARVTATVHWVFKDPKYTTASSQTDIFDIDTSGNYVPSVNH